MLSHYTVTKQDRKCTGNATLRRVRPTIVVVDKQCVTRPVCVLVALGFQHVMHIHHIVFCGLPRSNFFFPTLSHKRHD